MQTLRDIKTLLDQAGLRPKKSLGQNFLHDANLVRKLVDHAGVGPGDLVLEVGPGTGTLTDALLDQGCEVIACELDDGLALLLSERLAGPIESGVCTIVHSDCLASKRALAAPLVSALAGRPFRLVANLPYHAATPLMLTLMTSHPECAGQFVTVQKEVAQRLCAPAGDPAYGSVSVVAGATCRPAMISTLPPTCFWPRPEVTSAMMSLERLEHPATTDAQDLAAFSQRLFTSRRKQLGKVVSLIAGGEIAWPEGVGPTQRCEALSPEQFEALRLAVRERRTRDHG